MLKWTVRHTQMIRVLMRIEMIPNVPRCFGSPIHKYVGLSGVVLLVAGTSIYLCVSIHNRFGKDNVTNCCGSWG